MLYLLTFFEEVGSGSSRIQLSPLYSPSTARIASESVTDLHCCCTGCEAARIKKFSGDTLSIQKNERQKAVSSIWNPLPSIWRVVVLIYKCFRYG
jgi:hypothetical protein